MRFPDTRLTRLLPLLLAAFLALSLWSPPEARASFSGKRVALVVGNSKYPTAPLRNPGNDARAIAKSLKELGFEVVLRENASQRDLAGAIRQFGSSITPGSAALFYFAGHGMQVKGRNYLVPVDADIQVEDEVPYSAIDANLVLDKMEVGKSAINIVILDACRNNPFSRRFRSSATGLAEMIAPIGTLIAFATAPGSVAQDGSGENGVYTKHLLESIAMPGLPVEQMFKRVRVGVTKETNEAQVPWESSSMKGDFAFKEAAPVQTASQDKLIEEAVRAAAERAAALTAERLQREQAARQPQQDRARAEIDSLAAEREKLLRERERLSAENEALRRKSAQPPETVAIAARQPLSETQSIPNPPQYSLRPKVGDHWTYRYSNSYGKSETYTVRVKTVADQEITDEARTESARHAGHFENGLGLTDRKLGHVTPREISPYLSTLGPFQETEEWKSVTIFPSSSPFVARFAGSETIQVPAGTFETRKLVIQGSEKHPRSSGGGSGQSRDYTITVWYSPVAKRFVKLNFTGAYNPLFPSENETIELVGVSFDMKAEPLAANAKQAALRIASQPPVSDASGLVDLPKEGDSWTYRFTDNSFGKSETYTVKVNSASKNEVVDEARLGKSRHIGSFEPDLALENRNLGDLNIREISPYLLSLSNLEELSNKDKASMLVGSDRFIASLSASETVKVPAGTYETRKLVLKGKQTHPRFSHSQRDYTITVWYAPTIKRFVKQSFIGFHHSIFPPEQEVIELMEFRLQ